MTTVFDVAAEFTDRAGGQIEPVKLQKLCFYAFGWFAHLTGEALFGERFYAMRYGPVVGELLSSHAKKRSVDHDLLQAQFDVRESEREHVGSYVSAVIDSVWNTYGKHDQFELAEYSHDEDVWRDAWDARQSGSLRADMFTDEVIRYFRVRQPSEGEVVDLPPAMTIDVPTHILDEADSSDSVHWPFISALQETRRADK